MQRQMLLDGRLFAWRELGVGQPLVLLHGWSMSSAVFNEALDRLATHFRVLAPDLRGHGHSAPGPDYALSSLAADVSAWCDALQLEPVNLLGWSLGGQVAMTMAVDSPQRVRRLALVCSTPRFCNGDGWEGGLPVTQVKAMERNLKRNFAGTMGDFFFSMFAGESLPPERLRQILRESVRSVPPAASEVSVAGLSTLRDSDLRATARRLSCSTLVHYGDRDVITPPAAGVWLSENIDGAHRHCAIGLGHAPFFSAATTTFEVWREFFA